MATTQNQAAADLLVEKPAPLDESAAPPFDQYCDVVLKGGVVDGVIYPGVLIELARKFRFQSVAGTSVGAIAAGLTAASEYARRFGFNTGFDEVLRNVPEELAKPSPNVRGQTKIRSLFQPEERLQRFFNFIVDIISSSPREWHKKIPLTVLKFYWWPLLIFFVFGLLFTLFAIVGGPEQLRGPMPKTVGANFLLIVQLVLSFAYAIAASAVGLILVWLLEFCQLVKQPGFGFCSGLSIDGGKTEGLTDWLHRGIQGASRRPLHSPLTFQDLWDAPLGPNDENGRRRPKSIDLRMMATCVSHGRPYEFPLEDRSVRLFFNLKEWEPYFPKTVIDHLRANCDRYTQDSVEYVQGGISTDTIVKPTQNENLAVSPHPGDPANTSDFFEMPRGKLPILVAIRLSMNFPILFQAVPTYAIDHERWNVNLKETPKPSFRQAWFTDGGVTSNFPMHIFDKPVPSWPTFGIYLADKYRKQGKEYAPYRITELHSGGRSEKWRLIGQHDDVSRVRRKSSGFMDYVLSLVSTGKDWADNANLRMPGIRDRVVTIFTGGMTSGGLNLNISKPAIWTLAYVRGTQAGVALANKFSDITPKFNAPLVGSAAWMDHRWVRFNTYLTAIKSHLEGFSKTVNQSFATSPLRTQIDQAKTEPPLQCRDEYESTLTDMQAKALKNAVAALETLEQALCADKVVQPYKAKPQPELKSYPRL